MSNITTKNPISIISAEEFTAQAKAKMLAHKTAAETAAENWMRKVMNPAIESAINSAAINYFPDTISVKFEGQELAGYDATTVQNHVRATLMNHGYINIEFKDKKLTFSVKK